MGAIVYVIAMSAWAGGGKALHTVTSHPLWRLMGRRHQQIDVIQHERFLVVANSHTNSQHEIIEECLCDR